MNAQSAAIIRDVFARSNAGAIHFGQVVGMLADAGVESYWVDYRSGRSTYYQKDGATLALEAAQGAVADAFSADGVRAAIGGAQRGEVMYPEFKRLTLEAGCIGYVVWLAGRHVSYFGRRGETHVERFPD